MQLIVISLKEEFYNKVSSLLLRITLHWYLSQADGLSILFLPTALSLE